MTESTDSPWEPLGKALLDYHRGASDARIVVWSDAADPEELPVSLFFRGEGELTEIDREAIVLCRGRVLDVGATCGALSLLLQEGGHEVTAIDSLPQALTIMRERGVQDVRDADLFTFQPAERFDTVLLLMNGTALAGTLPGLDRLLTVLHDLVAPGGAVLMDSTDLRRRGATASGRDDGRYMGEIEYQLEYRGHRGSPIPQLFVDPDTLRERAHENGWDARVACQEDSGSYLGVLTRAAP